MPPLSPETRQQTLPEAANLQLSSAVTWLDWAKNQVSTEDGEVKEEEGEGEGEGEVKGEEEFQINNVVLDEKKQRLQIYHLMLQSAMPQDSLSKMSDRSNKGMNRLYCFMVALSGFNTLLSFIGHGIVIPPGVMTAIGYGWNYADGVGAGVVGLSEYQSYQLKGALALDLSNTGQLSVVTTLSLLGVLVQFASSWAFAAAMAATCITEYFRAGFEEKKAEEFNESIGKIDHIIDGSEDNGDSEGEDEAGDTNQTKIKQLTLAKDILETQRDIHLAKRDNHMRAAKAYGASFIAMALVATVATVATVASGGAILGIGIALAVTTGVASFLSVHARKWVDKKDHLSELYITKLKLVSRLEGLTNDDNSQGIEGLETTVTIENSWGIQNETTMQEYILDMMQTDHLKAEQIISAFESNDDHLIRGALAMQRHSIGLNIFGTENNLTTGTKIWEAINKVPVQGEEVEGQAQEEGQGQEEEEEVPLLQQQS